MGGVGRIDCHIVDSQDLYNYNASSQLIRVLDYKENNSMTTKPWMMLVTMMAGWINRQQQEATSEDRIMA